MGGRESTGTMLAHDKIERLQATLILANKIKSALLTRESGSFLDSVEFRACEDFPFFSM